MNLHGSKQNLISRSKLKKGDRMEDFVRELTKEQWERYQKNELKASELFSEAAIMGYGVYLGRAFEHNGKYFIRCSMGSSCD